MILPWHETLAIIDSSADKLGSMALQLENSIPTPFA
jgi:hypothetical protein